MNLASRPASLCLIPIVAILLAVASPAFGQKFKTALSGAQEVPEVATSATGKFQIRFNKDLSEASYQLKVFEGVEITQAHLHCAKAGTNGPVVVFVAGPFDPAVNSDGVLSSGTMTNDDIALQECDCGADESYEINNIASLASAVSDNCIYVNVHSTANPGGEIRGQVIE